MQERRDSLFSDRPSRSRVLLDKASQSYSPSVSPRRVRPLSRQESLSKQLSSLVSVDEKDLETILLAARLQKFITDSQDNHGLYLRLYLFLRLLRHSLFLLYFCIGFLETPIWCTPDYSDHCQRSPTGVLIVTSRVTYLSLPVFMYTELFIMATLTILKTLKYRFRTKRAAHRRRKLLFYLLLSLLSFLSNLLRLYRLPFNLAAFIRPLFILAYSHVFKQALLNYVKILYSTKLITVVVFFNIVFFGCVAKVVFTSTVYESAMFSSLLDNLYTMTLLNIGANYPKVMFPIMAESRVKILFFVTFILFHNLFMAKLFIGIIYINYKELLCQETKRQLTNRVIYQSIL